MQQEQPGRIGDNSLSLSLTNPALTSCSFLNEQSVTSSGCYMNYDKSYALLYGGNYGAGNPGGALTGSVSFTGSSGDSFTAATMIIPSGVRQYNSLVVGNSDIRYIMKDSTDSFIEFSNLDNTTNRQASFSYNTMRMTNNILGLGSSDQTQTFTPTNTFQANANSWFSSSLRTSFNGANINFYGTTSNFDISQNYVNDFRYLATCDLTTLTGASTFSGGTFTNNNVLDDYFIEGQNSPSCQWTGNLIQDNRITGSGTSGSTLGGFSYVLPIAGLDNPTPSTPNLVRYNIIYGTYRAAGLVRGTTWDHNVFMTRSPRFTFFAHRRLRWGASRRRRNNHQ